MLQFYYIIFSVAVNWVIPSSLTNRDYGYGITAVILDSSIMQEPDFVFVMLHRVGLAKIESSADIIS